MSDCAGFEVPEFEDSAIPWVCEVLSLPATAFSGPDGQDPRLPVLKSLSTLDVEACPGSGKTTLLVAKLAILARKWPEPRRGLCVLSHTNVARREIEQRLGSTAEGQCLLSYPHFIGTIHRFVNEFLAIPWLRSKRYPIEMIDDEIALGRRWRKLPFPTRTALETNRYDQGLLRFRDAAFGLGEIRWGKKGTLGEDTTTYQALRNACRESALDGYFCYDEMFVWAHELMDKVPEVTDFLRKRFPLLFIDEVQDNSEPQSKLLHRVFIEGADAVVRQRFGDANQAIYQHAGQMEGAATDPFPTIAVRTDIPNSFRFGQSIADLADPLALEPQGLQGKRQAAAGTESDTSGKHTIFLFDDKSVDRVLEAYATYLIEVFSKDELRKGTFTAVGAVHRPSADDNVPRYVGHYWPVYDHEFGLSDPQPKTFVQYVMAGHRLSQTSGETHVLVEKIAEAVIRLARIANSEFKPDSRKRKHRYVLELLDENGAARAIYIDLVRNLAVERAALTEREWDDKWKSVVTRVVEGIAKVQVTGNRADDFLDWVESEGAEGANADRKHSDNFFRYPQDNPSVEIRVGSIHSVKGETHTATLVLDTFYRAHHLKTLKPWLLGEKAGGCGANPAVQSRLKIHYVAMTRPSRLLCMSMREDAFSTDELALLKRNSWRVARVNETATVWL